MKSYRPAVMALAAVIAVGGWVLVGSGQQPSSQPLQLAPLGTTGEAIFPAFEGHGQNKQGQTVLLLGYFNRNRDQPIDIPIGPDNRIEPGGPDFGQPTHFQPGRQWGVFGIAAAKDMGTKRLTWTLTANGKVSVVSFWLNPAYVLDFFKHPASGNEPPVIRFAADGPTMTGPPTTVAQTLTGTVGQPVTLKLWASDNPETYDPTEGLSDAARAATTRGRGADAAGRGAAAARGAAAQNFDLTAAAGRGGVGGRGGRGGGPPADVSIAWKKYRGPGNVKVADDPIRLLNKGDHKAVMEATTTATFSAPGEYWMRAQVNDESGDGGGGDQCCWTTAHVKVNVK